MARIRSIKPEFFRHEELFSAEKNSGLPLRIAFSGLWTVADREGRFKWRPNVIKLDVLPFDDVEMDEVLAVLVLGNFIQKYTVEGEEYGFIPSFLDHQVINSREAKSTLPDIACADMCTHVQVNGEGKGREGKGEGTREAGFNGDQRPPVVQPDLLTSKEEVFQYLKNNYHVIEDAKKTVSGMGWKSVDELDVIAFIKLFISAKAKMDQPPEDIRQHFRNWLFREPIDKLSQYATTFKQGLK